MRLTRVPALIAALCGLAGLLAACGDSRSPDAYCRAFYSKAAPIRQSYVDADRHANSDPLGAITVLLSAPGDMVSIFDGMIDHAPDDIKSDTVEVRDSFKQMQSTMGDAVSSPLKALGKALVGSFTSAGSFRRVDAYLQQHCPVSSPLAQRYIRAAR